MLTLNAAELKQELGIQADVLEKALKDSMTWLEQKDSFHQEIERLNKTLNQNLTIDDGNLPFLLSASPDFISLESQLNILGIPLPKINFDSEGLSHNPQKPRNLLYLAFNVNYHNVETNLNENIFAFGLPEACALLRIKPDIINDKDLLLLGKQYYSMFFFGIGKNRQKISKNHGDIFIFEANLKTINNNGLYRTPTFKEIIEARS